MAIEGSGGGLAGVWAPWTPTLTWTTATPTSVTTTARWLQIGRLVFVTVFINAGDSRGTTDLMISLPIAARVALPTTVLPAREMVKVGFDFTFYDPMAYVNSSQSRIEFAKFQPGLDTKQIWISIAGYYEVW